MNHESFADAETAALMNDTFINIKVDREERPDIDQLYQTAANDDGQQGGWPLTMFLTPKGVPFFAGTYFPKEERFGQPRVQERAATTWPGSIANSPIRSPHRPRACSRRSNNLWDRDMRGELDAAALDIVGDAHRAAIRHLLSAASRARRNFPPSRSIEMMWRAYLRTGAPQFFQLVADRHARQHAARRHLRSCRRRLLRYATDERWLVPHFEKMLYDNAQLIDLMTLVWQHNRNAALSRPHRGNDRLAAARDESGAMRFAASLDADSEGEEGKYYVWSEPEIDAALTGTFSSNSKRSTTSRREGNFQGRNILHRIGGSRPIRSPKPTKRCSRSSANCCSPRALEARARRCATTRCWPTGTA